VTTKLNEAGVTAPLISTMVTINRKFNAQNQTKLQHLNLR